MRARTTSALDTSTWVGGLLYQVPACCFFHQWTPSYFFFQVPTKDIVGAKSVHRVQSHVNLNMHYDMEYFLGMVELAPFLHIFCVCIVTCFHACFYASGKHTLFFFYNEDILVSWTFIAVPKGNLLNLLRTVLTFCGCLSWKICFVWSSRRGPRHHRRNCKSDSRSKLVCRLDTKCQAV